MAKSIILNELLDTLRYSVRDFELEIGVPLGRIYKSIQRNTDISLDTVSKIITKFPKVNREWLLTGEGDMFVETIPIPTPKRKVRLIGEAVAGGDMEINVHDDNSRGQYIDVGDLLSDSEAAFTVYGNSMTPAYPSGCVLGIKLNSDNFIQPGETYLLVTKSNRVFKRLYYNQDKTGYICISDNTMKHETGPMTGQYFYPPFEVDGSDVLHVYDVTGMIRRNRNSGIIQRQK